MRYIDESLAPGETILQRGKWPTSYWVMAWASLIVLGIIVVGVFIFIGMVVKMKTTDFAVTNRRVILKEGWLNRRTHELSVASVEGVALTQTLWARLFGYGRVVVTGTGEATIVFPPMGKPVAFRRAIEAARADGHAAVSTVRETPDRADAANDDAANDGDHTVEEGPAPRRKRGFIGLMNR
jgi:uncharacterized membrane protein YdbT with pleckstrin-like domain